MNIFWKTSKPSDKPVVPAKQPWNFLGEAHPSVQQHAQGYHDRIEAAKSTRAAMEMEQKIMKKMRIVEPPKNRRCGNCWVLFLALLQVLGAVGIIVLISTCLTSTKDLPDEELSVSYSVCYMTTRSINACAYGQWVAAVSLFLSILIACINLCVVSRRSTCCMSFEGILGLFGTFWWLAAAITCLIFANEANSANIPYEDCRMASWILSFATAALFFLAFITSTLSCCASYTGIDDLV